jgi:hypothetical protein
MKISQFAQFFTIMKIFTQVALWSGFTLATTLAALVPTAQAFEIQSATFIGQQTIPNNAPIAGTPATNLNGLSGITYAGNDTYYVVNDNAPTGDAKFHTLTIKIQGIVPGSAVQVLPVSTTYLKTATGTAIPAQALDNEGIALTRDGKLWISSEGYITRNPVVDPTINQFSVKTGQQLGTLPIDAKFKATFEANGNQLTGIQTNRGFEGLTITPDNRYLTAMTESALITDGTQKFLKNTLTNPSEFRRSRVLRNDLQTQTSQEFLYNAETIPVNIFAPGLTAVSEILALDSTGDRYLALERTYVQSSPSVFSAKLYEVDLKGATDIGTKNAGSTGIIPAQKQLVFDFANLRTKMPNLEAMTWGPVLPNGQRSLILMSDNNYSPSSPTGPTVNTTQFFVLSIGLKPTTLLNTTTR